jgi:capsid protein
MVHVFEPSRIGQHRGITLFHSVLHTIHDLDDLQRFEMVAAKDAASRANIVYTETGELPKTRPGLADSVLGVSTPADDRQSYYEKAFPGKTIALRRGDKWEQSQALRPSPAMREFWEYLTKTVCKGVGISHAAVEDYAGAWGGAALRAAIVSDNRFYDIRTRSMTNALDRIWQFFVINTPELRPFPADFRKVRWQPPKRATVDVGRESKAILEELRAGVRNYRDVLGEMGLDWRDTIRQRIAEQKFIADTADQLGVPSGLVLSLLGAANNTNIFAEKAGEAIDGPSDQPSTKPAEVDQ